MILHNVGYDHRHDSDFLIDRPDGSGDTLFLLLKSDAVFTLNGADTFVPKRSVFIFPQGMPQQYRCMPHQSFANDWMHFVFENDEEQRFLEKGILYAEPIPLQYTEYCSYCIKAIANENSSDHRYKDESIMHYFWLMMNQISEQIRNSAHHARGSLYEMLLTVRNQIYTYPYWEWSVNWGAHQTRMSRSAFQHHYKAQFGIPFIQDLINSRLEYAKTLLLTTDMPVQDVGNQCGYQNYEHFARQFKTRCQMSPGEFRKQGGTK